MEKHYKTISGTSWELSPRAVACFDDIVIEVSLDSFWVIAEGSADQYTWCEHTETWGLEVSGGATDEIPQETWEIMKEAIAKLREDWRMSWFPYDS